MVWTEDSQSADLAVSFLDAEACEEAESEIDQVQTDLQMEDCNLLYPPLLIFPPPNYFLPPPPFLPLNNCILECLD